MLKFVEVVRLTYLILNFYHSGIAAEWHIGAYEHTEAELSEKNTCNDATDNSSDEYTPGTFEGRNPLSSPPYTSYII